MCGGTIYLMDIDYEITRECLFLMIVQRPSSSYALDIKAVNLTRGTKVKVTAIFQQIEVCANRSEISNAAILTTTMLEAPSMTKKCMQNPFLRFLEAICQRGRQYINKQNQLADLYGVKQVEIRMTYINMATTSICPLRGK